MSFDFNTINEDNYIEIIDFIEKNRQNYEAIRRKRRNEEAKTHLAKYNIKAGMRFTYQRIDSRFDINEVYYLEIKEVRKTRASCKGVQTFPEQRALSNIEVDIVNIIPDNEKT